MRQWRVHVVCGLVLLCAADASAQTAPRKDRVFVNINFSAQPRSQDDASQFTFPLFREEATVDVARTIKGGGFIDVSAGAPLFRQMGLAVSFMRRASAADATLTASLPDPIFYDSPQALSGTLSALEHEETSVGLLVFYQIPLTPRLGVMVLAGPAVTRLHHEVVTEVSLDPATGEVSAQLAMLSRDFLGMQGGVDVRYLLARWLGVGGYVRYQSTKGNLGPTVQVDLGGLQYGAGLRLRF